MLVNAVLILLPLGTWLVSEPPARELREGREVILEKCAPTPRAIPWKGCLSRTRPGSSNKYLYPSLTLSYFLAHPYLTEKGRDALATKGLRRVGPKVRGLTGTGVRRVGYSPFGPSCEAGAVKLS